ncbi:MAG: hypothetical protein KDK41_14560 [Leptospiraceae bacterium]|nr:hypothetical protein [Leptospiraceae bacterium]
MYLQLITFCSSGLPRDSKLQCEKIGGVAGPEDFAYAQIENNDLLLISSHERRD